MTGSSAVGSAPRSGRGGRAFESPLPDKCSISIVVIILACHAGDEDSISSCCSKTLPFSIKAIIQDSGSWDTCSIRVTATTHGGHERRCSVSAYGPYARGGPRNRINEMSHGKVYKIPIMRLMESKTGRVPVTAR